MDSLDKRGCGNAGGVRDTEGADLELAPITDLRMTCSGCPSQWDGIMDGRKVYVRYRWGYLSIRVGAPGDFSEYAAVRGKEIFGRKVGDGFDGFLTEDQLIAATRGTLQFERTSVPKTNE